MKKPIDFKVELTKERLAAEISDYWSQWDSARKPWKEQKKEIRNYIFATDTRTTTNSKLPWKNSTTLPKLCQLRDNLHANYIAALLSSEDWLMWQAGDEEAATKEKANAAEDYMFTKLELQKFGVMLSKLVLDYIDYGNVFAGIYYEVEYVKDEQTGENIPGYIGPKIYRISPFDIVFDPSVQSFSDSPKVVRSLVNLGQLKKMSMNMDYDTEKITRELDLRNNIREYGSEDVGKNEGYSMDGFGSLYQYYRSPYVELLEFRGDIYDSRTQEIQQNRLITVMDRRVVIRNVQNPNPSGEDIFHAGWRERPDNLWAMGPLDNLVGMQYRIDHIENAKADAVDQYIHPPKKIKGYVEDFDDVPDERIICGEDGDVEFMRPPLDQILQYDAEINNYQNLMEEMAGAPKQAMGIRTPGEKTAYEVQTLESAAGRIFQNKVNHFEETFLEPMLNGMLALARTRLEGSDLIRSLDDDFGVASFLTITKEDLSASGKLRARGARHFAAQNKLVQELTNLSNSAIGQDPAVNVHLSGKKIAQLIEELLGLEKYGIFAENIRVLEQSETQKLVNSAQQQIDVEDQTPTEEPV